MSVNQILMNREKNTIRHMIGMYCRARHHMQNTLCAECNQLLDYSTACIDRCPYKEGKPTCAKCPIHCYKPAMREKIRRVMRYAGPRMMIFHPVLAFLHFAGDLRRVKNFPKKTGG
jgi:predicted amidophosphoribosyltransferase